jgi:hypothetical protein
MRVWILGILLCCTRVMAFGTDNVPSLDGLSQGDRFNVIVSALEARDERLRNLQYQVQKSGRNYNYNPQGGGGWEAEHVLGLYDLKRIGDRRLLRIRFGQVGKRKNSDTAESWDGNEARAFAADPTPSGAIRDKPSRAIIDDLYNHLLGYAVKMAPEETLARWLREMSRKSVPGKMIEVHVEGALWYVCVVDGVQTFHAFWIDPARDCMPVRYEGRFISYEQRPNQIDWGAQYRGGWESHWVEKAESVSGVWIPKQIMVRTGNGAWTKFSEMKFDVKEFSVGGVREEDLKLEFPVGCEVVDSARGIAFAITPNGREPKRLYDPASGTISINGVREARVSNGGGDGTLQGAGKEREIVVTNVRWTQWGVGVAMCVVGGALLAWVVLSRTRKLRSGVARAS